jgi:hypothetical protein
MGSRAKAFTGAERAAARGGERARRNRMNATAHAVAPGATA